MGLSFDPTTLPESEQDIKRDILSMLKGLGILAWDNRVNSRRGRLGTSNKNTADILGILRGGRALCVEVKKPGAKPRNDQEHQREWLQKADALGALVVTATGTEGVLSALKGAGYIGG